MTLPKEEQQPPISTEDQALLAKWDDEKEEFTWEDEEDRYRSYIYDRLIKKWFAELDKVSEHYIRTVQKAEYLGMFGKNAIWRVEVHHKDIKRAEGHINLSFTGHVYIYHNDWDQDDQFYYLDREAKDVRTQPDPVKVKKYLTQWEELP